MIQESITADEVVAFLNEALKTDPDAMNRLFEKKALCNKAMVDHPTIQVDCEEPGFPKFGVLGLLNGLFGVDDDGWGAIAAVYAVVCPVGEHPVGKGRTIRDKCSSCGVLLALGELEGFQRVQQ